MSKPPLQTPRRGLTFKPGSKPMEVDYVAADRPVPLVAVRPEKTPEVEASKGRPENAVKAEDAKPRVGSDGPKASAKMPPVLKVRVETSLREDLGEQIGRLGRVASLEVARRVREGVSQYIAAKQGELPTGNDAPQSGYKFKVVVELDQAEAALLDRLHGGMAAAAVVKITKFIASRL